MFKLLRFFFHHFYHTFAWTYDFVAAMVSIGRWQDWGRAALPYLRGERILELGFGPGHLQVELNRRGVQAWGLDESRQMIRQARARLAQNGLPAALMRGHAQFLPFASDSLDCVISTFPSEYIMDTRTLSEVRRVLKPDGRFVIVPMAWIGGQSLPDQAARFLFRITRQSEQPTDNVQDRIKAVFAEYGFRVEVSEVEVRHSVVLVIVAEKSPASEPLPSPN